MFLFLNNCEKTIKAILVLRIYYAVYNYTLQETRLSLTKRAKGLWSMQWRDCPQIRPPPAMCYHVEVDRSKS